MMRLALHWTGLPDFINKYIPKVVGFFFVLFVYITISVFKFLIPWLDWKETGIATYYSDKIIELYNHLILQLDK
jgi:hypothetical protein